MVVTQYTGYIRYPGGSKYFSVLDLKSGFHQIKMEENSIKYTAFITRRGLYEFLYMGFGIASHPQVFSKAMHTAFVDMIWKEILIFIDDIVIFSDTWEEHNLRLTKFLQKCISTGLKLNLKKCHFFKGKVFVTTIIFGLLLSCFLLIISLTLFLIKLSF